MVVKLKCIRSISLKNGYNKSLTIEKDNEVSCDIRDNGVRFLTTENDVWSMPFSVDSIEPYFEVIGQ